MSAPGFREFVPDRAAPSPDHVWHDTCGEYALTFAEARAKSTKATPEEMLVLTHDMVAHKEHNHGTTPRGLVDEAHRRGLTVQLHEGLNDAQYHNVLLEAKDAGKGVVIFLTLAENLMDCETGVGYSFRPKPFVQNLRDYPLHGHYIYMDHAQANGYVCADGANPESFKRYSVYTWATIAKSQVAALIVVDNIAHAPEPKPVPAPEPAPKPEVPAELTSLLADLSNLLNPYVTLANEVAALRKKLGI